MMKFAKDKSAGKDLSKTTQTASPAPLPPLYSSDPPPTPPTEHREKRSASSSDKRWPAPMDSDWAEPSFDEQAKLELLRNYNAHEGWGEATNDETWVGLMTEIHSGKGKNIKLSPNESTAVNVTGNPDDNNITGNQYDNILLGGRGNDTFGSSGGNDLISGGDGVDTVKYSLEESRMYIDLLDHYAENQSGSKIDFLEGIENIYATPFSDFLYGNDSDNLIYAGLGNDIVYGLGGDDVLYGSQGNDSLYGGDDHDELFGEQGEDSLFGVDGDDLLNGGDDNDHLFGGNGNDTLIGGLGRDVFVFDTFRFLDTSQAAIIPKYSDTIEDYEVGIDKIQIVRQGYEQFDQDVAFNHLQMHVNPELGLQIIHLAGSITISNVFSASFLTPDDFIFTARYVHMTSEIPSDSDLYI